MVFSLGGKPFDVGTNPPAVWSSDSPAPDLHPHFVQRRLLRNIKHRFVLALSGKVNLQNQCILLGMQRQKGFDFILGI
jgi:hypothetical protein